MKKNIIFIYIIYFITLYILYIIDTAILMYYIFWIINIFVYPFIWLWIKIVYYNRTVLLLLLFYYLIAKYTIKEQGYKYFLFFNIDIRKWHSIYSNYIWNMTTYHIEIISIYLFFIAIIMPFFIINKEMTFLVISLFSLFIYFLIIMKKKLIYIKDNKKKFNLRFLIIFSLFFIFFFKLFNYQYIKDIYTLYLHLDEWAFGLLEWKIQMYNKATEKDYYSKTVGLKPIWVSEKLNKKDYINNKYWEYLCKKKNKKIINEFKFKLKKTKKKLYLFFKYYDKYLKVKKKKLYLNKRYDKLFFKYNKNREINTKLFVKDFIPKKYIRNENPVVTQEKERERTLHRAFVSSKIFEFSIDNYYRLNYLLKLLTLDKLYYQPFFDKKGAEKQLLNEKKNFFHSQIKNRLYNKSELIMYKKMIYEIKKNKLFLKKMEAKNLIISNNQKKENANNNFFKNYFNYMILKKEGKNKDLLKLKIIFKKIKHYDKIFYKKKSKLNMKIYLEKIMNDIKIKKNINQLTFISDSKKNILNKDKIKEVKKISYNLTYNYVEKNEIERFDNKMLFNTVKKYNEEKNTSSWKSEFNKSLILKEKKEGLKSFDSPDLSRRNKK